MDDATANHGSDTQSDRTPTTPNEDRIDVDIPDHQLLRCIGRGSYGQVWLARNVMGAYRAIKIVSRNSFKNQRPFERELSGIRKFEPISRSFDGFINVLHVGINNEGGYFYYVMELGDDVSLGQAIDPANYSPKTLAKDVSLCGSLPLRDCLQLGLALSRALAELHKRGLVHRDIKPSNIIFVNGLPKLADIGLVADFHEARSYVGTEGFIPPEGPGTAQADVYSLGKVLYECSTGKDRQDFPELPTLLDQLPDRVGFLELNEIVLNACRTNPAERYASAWDLHADLLVAANGRSVKRLKLLERRLVQIKRTAAVVLVVSILVAAVTYHFYREWQNADEARQRQVGASIAYGNQTMESGDLLGALPYFTDALRLDENNKAEAINHRLRLGAILSQCPKVTAVWFSGTPANDTAFAPDGESVLVVEEYGQVKLYDIRSSRMLRAFGPDYGLRAATFSPSGRLILAASEENKAIIWNTDGSGAPQEFPQPQMVLSARFAPDELRIIIAGKSGEGGTNGIAQVINLKTREVELSLTNTRPVMFADFSKDGRYIVTASYDGSAQIWDAKNGRRILPPLKHENWVTYAAFSPDNSKVITTSVDKKARVWDLATGRKVLLDMNHADVVQSAEFSPDGRLILTACYDGTVRLWSAETLQPLGLHPILRHVDRVMHASFAPDGHRIVVACADGTALIWDLAGALVQPQGVKASLSADGSRFALNSQGKIRIQATASGKMISALNCAGALPEIAELNPNGRFAITVTTSKPTTNSPGNACSLQVWNAETGESIAPPISLSNVPSRRALSHTGKYLALFESSTLRLWNLQNSTFVTLPFPEKQPLNLICFSPDDSRLAAAAAKGTQVFVWNVAAGALAFPPLPHRSEVSYAEFSADGRLLISACANGLLEEFEAQVWSSTTGQPVGLPLRHGDGVSFATLSRDGSRAVTAGEDFLTCLWDVATSKQLIPAVRHDFWVRTADFDSKSRWIVTASSDKTARVWNANNGSPLGPPLRHLHQVSRAKFIESDGKVVSVSGGRVRVWPLPVEAKPLSDLAMLAQLLSGNLANPGSRTNRANNVESFWKQLHTAYPTNFATSLPELVAWHEFQAADSEMQEAWAAVEFHLKWLASLQPQDQSIAQRLTAVRGRLNLIPSHPGER